MGVHVWTEALCPGRFQTCPCLSLDSLCKVECLTGSFWAHQVPGAMAGGWLTVGGRALRGIIKNVKSHLSALTDVCITRGAGGPTCQW